MVKRYIVKTRSNTGVVGKKIQSLNSENYRQEAMKLNYPLHIVSIKLAQSHDKQ